MTGALIVQIFNWIILGIGLWVIGRELYQLFINRKTVTFTHKRSGKSITVSVKMDREDCTRFAAYLKEIDAYDALNQNNT